jgi:hypothetical protein
MAKIVEKLFFYLKMSNKHNSQYQRFEHAKLLFDLNTVFKDPSIFMRKWQT